MLAKLVEEHNDDNPEVVRGASFYVYIRSSLLLLLLTACYLSARFMGISATNRKTSELGAIHILIALIILLHVSCVRCDSLLQCEDGREICMNNGICLLTSQATAHRICRRSETYYNGKCYQLFLQPVSWEQAAKNCHSAEGGLAVIESDSERRFVSDYLQTEIDTAGRSDDDLGVWTAGHSVANFSEAVYVWMPQHYLIQNNFWEQRQPTIYSNLTDSCIFLRRQSTYSDWTTSPCLFDRYYLCSRNASDDGAQLMNIQCLCMNGYRGEFCDTQPQRNESQSIACNNQSFEFACSSGATIQVDFAAYGYINTESRQMCGSATTINGLQQESCIALASLQTLKNRCQGLTFCKIDSLSSLFPDSPCPATVPTSLLYRMRCSIESLTRCRNASIYHKGRCYQVNYESEISKRLSWFDANTACSEQGGNLVTTIDEAVNNQLVAAMKGQTNTITNYWIGIITQPSDGLPITQSGQPVDFVPSNSLLEGRNLCIGYDVSSTFAVWVTQSCSDLNNWICEFAPEPAQRRERPVENYMARQPHRIRFMGTKSSDQVDVSGEQGYCEEHEWNGMRIPRTLACREVILPCPNPETTIGVVVQKCSCDILEWLPEPDTNNCTHKWIAELNEAIQNNDPAENISRTLSNHLQRTLQSGIYGGDITGSVDISEELLPLARRQYNLLYDRNERSTKATTFTEELGEAGDQLLGSLAEPVWMQLNHNVRIAKASTLMSVLEQSAILMADFIFTRQKKMNFDNWALEVQVQKRQTFPMDDAPQIPAMLSSGSSLESQSTQISSSNYKLTSTLIALPPSHATNTEPPIEQVISFSGFSLSPSMSLPPMNVLEESYEQSTGNSQNEALGTPLGFAASPRMRTVSLDRNPMRLGYYIFKSVGTLLTPHSNKIINSLVIGASVNNPNQSLQLPTSSPVTFTFYHIHTTNVANPQCVFWNSTTKIWSDEGCQILRTSDESTDCSCNHLTSFAILMDVTGKLDVSLEPPSAAALNVITIIGCALSTVCLLISFLIFSCFRSLWNVRNTIHRNLCLCLLIAELVFVFGIDRTENKAICSAIAVVLHYFFLASFCWMLLEGYQLYLMLIQVFEPDNVKILLYFLWAYGFPAVIVAVSAGVAWPSYGTQTYCWIDANSPTIWAFVGPITVVIIANIVFLAVALKVVMSVKSRDRTKGERIAGWLKGSATLLCLLGITWIFGYMMAISKAESIFAYIFTILNCTQGVFIFVLHVLLNEKVRVTLLRFARTQLCCMSESGAAYNSRSYLSSRQKILNMIKGSESSSSDAQRSSGGSSSSNARKMKLDQKSPLGEYDETPPRKPTPPPIYLEFRAKAPDDGPQTAESTLESESPKSDEKQQHFTEFGNQNNSESRRSTAPIRRKKFPLGTSEEERGSQYTIHNIIIERF